MIQIMFLIFCLLVIQCFLSNVNNMLLFLHLFPGSDGMDGYVLAICLGLTSLIK
jgi:hypothetical protein